MNNQYNNGNFNNNAYNNQNTGYNPNTMMNNNAYNNQNTGYNPNTMMNNNTYNNQNTGYNQPINNSVNNPNNNTMLNSNSNTLFNPNPVYNNVPQEPENFTKGIIGAVLGALLGSIVLIILYQIGIVASISGLIMAGLAGVGYEKLGGHMSKKGAIASVIVVFIVIFLSYNVAVSIEIANALKEIGYDFSIFEVLKNVFNYLESGIIDSGAYWGNLIAVYVFSAFGAIGLLKK